MYLVLFGGCFYSFLFWVFLLISATERAHFSYSSQGFFSWVFFYRAFLYGSVLSSTALSSENACH